MREFLISIFAVDSVWSVVTRGLVWIIAVIILAYGADEGHKKNAIGVSYPQSQGQSDKGYNNNHPAIIEITFFHVQ